MTLFKQALNAVAGDDPATVPWATVAKNMRNESPALGGRDRCKGTSMNTGLNVDAHKAPVGDVCAQGTDQLSGDLKGKDEYADPSRGFNLYAASVKYYAGQAPYGYPFDDRYGMKTTHIEDGNTTYATHKQYQMKFCPERCPSLSGGKMQTFKPRSEQVAALDRFGNHAGLKIFYKPPSYRTGTEGKSFRADYNSLIAGGGKQFKEKPFIKKRCAGCEHGNMNFCPAGIVPLCPGGVCPPRRSLRGTVKQEN